MKLKQLTTTTFAALAAAVLLAGLASRAVAEDKEQTITGKGLCAKCALQETPKCQNAIQVEEGGKTNTYYLVGDVSKKFHDNLCQESKKVTATGTVKKVNDKLEFTVTKIELAK